ncbi:hypothetical protein K458DRAFT_382721 [Lentithecium fluviatile CBS 122367]|uniref:S-adenosyl-L-methionine-dependent methyltransferase n=1 Tax=Lentithecium fluviatile CBS 122367 TaxID=1168545 RepID=A0A6G1JKY4_9PLEO|nr:hypothetical protein K458DRAFT_382721 [Lentithecium fluviatile CBS 122367]
MDSTHGNDLVGAAQLLADQCRDAARSGRGLSDTTSIRAAIDRVQSLLFQLEPTAFLQHIASQSQLLACLQWLGEFQVLAYLPLGADGGLPIKDVAELADVPETHLCRVVRLMAMTGFLREPQPGFVAHTTLSASFVRRPAQLDAAMFLAETVAPSALHMAAATRRQEEFAVDWGSKRVQRQWPSFLSAVGGADDTDILAQMDWESMVQGDGPPGCVVDVGGPLPRKGGAAGASAAIFALAESHPTLRFVVQTDLPTAPAPMPATCNNNLAVYQRAQGTPQTITDAAVYLLRLSTSVCTPVRTRIVSELRAHLGVLQANRAALLILTSPLLPEPGAVPPHVERLARLRDLSLLQLVGAGNLTLQELVDLVDSIHDGNGGLVVVKKLHAPNSAVVGLGIRYQTIMRLTG